MGESTIGVEYLRYIYFTGENECNTNGPKCHLCMNETFRSNGLQDTNHVFVVAEGRLVPFMIESLVFQYGLDTPFSLNNIWQRHLVPDCVQCLARKEVNLIRQEVSQEKSLTEKQADNHVISEVVQNLLLDVSTSAQTTCPTENVSTEVSPTCSANANKRKICSDDAEIYAKQVKIEVDDEEYYTTGMTLSWGNIPLQTEAINNNIGDEPRYFTHPSFVVADSGQQIVQPSTSTSMTRSSVGKRRRPKRASNSNKLPLAEYDSEPSTTEFHVTPQQPDEWFPFMRGRCPSTVADPILSWSELNAYVSPIMQTYFKSVTVANRIARKHFKQKQYIHCSVCDINLSANQDFCYHLLGEPHFLEVTARNEVFSKFMDLRTFWNILHAAKLELMHPKRRIKHRLPCTEMPLMNIPDPSPLSKNDVSVDVHIGNMIENAPNQNGSDAGVSCETHRQTDLIRVSDNVKEESIQSDFLNASCSQPVTQTESQARPPSNKVERTTLQSEEWFPFLTGRCRSTVQDPINSIKDHRFLLLSSCGRIRDYNRTLEFMLSKYFDVGKEIVCSSCNIKISLRRGFGHFLSKRHFKSVEKQNRVFSKSLDLNRFTHLVNVAKSEQQHIMHTQIIGTPVPCPERMRLSGGSSKAAKCAPVTRRPYSMPSARELKRERDAQAAVHSRQPFSQYGNFLQTGNCVPSGSRPRAYPLNMGRDIQAYAHGRRFSSPYDNFLENKKIDFPFIRGRKKEDVHNSLFFVPSWQTTLNALSNEIRSNPRLQELAQQLYFNGKVVHYCEYCRQTVNTYDLVVHSLSSPHLQKVISTGEVFCKIRDYDEISAIFDVLKGKLNEKPLSPESLLPFGNGKPMEEYGQYASFQLLFDFLTALEITGKMDRGFYEFVAQSYSEIANVNLCCHCGPIALETDLSSISHFLSLTHIAKAMERGQVFFHDVRILKNLFSFYLSKSKCQEVGIILKSVEDAIRERTHSNYSDDFARMVHQILEADRMRQIFT